MATLLFLLLAFPANNFAPDNANSCRIDSTFFVELNKDHVKVIRRYIHENQRLGLQKDTTVIAMSISNKYGNQDYHEIQIGGTISRDVLRPNIPAYISEVDGYTVVVYFDWFQTSPGVKYPKSYLRKFEQVVNKLRRKKASPYPIDHFENWRVIFKKGEEPDVKILL